MCTITLHNFRSYQDKFFEFEFDKVILVKGDSGAGKTTLLQAFYWCLYGGQKNVSSFSARKGLCYVRLDFDDHSIYRQKNPERFLISLDNVTLEDDEAESFVIREYGGKDIFSSCCFIEQKNLCSFFEMQAQQRLDFLNVLSFNNQNPEEYKKKVDEKAKELGNRHKINVVLSDRIREEIMRMIEKKKPRDVLDCDERGNVEEELKELKEGYDEVVRKCGQEKNQKAVRKEIEEQLKESKEKLMKVRIYDEDEDELNEKIRDMEVSKKLKDRREGLEKSLRGLKKFKRVEGKEDKFERNEILDVSMNEKKISEYIRICKKHGVDYDEGIEEVRKELEGVIEEVERRERVVRSNNLVEQKKSKVVSEVRNLEKVFDGLKTKIDDSERELEKCTYEDEEIERLKEVLKVDVVYKCPECESNLWIEEGKLVKVKEVVKDKGILKNRLIILEKNKYRYLELMDNVRRWKGEIEVVKDKIESRREVLRGLEEEIEIIEETTQKGSSTEIKNMIKDLSKVEYLESSGFESKVMIEHNDYVDNEKEKERLMNEIKGINCDFDLKEYERVKKLILDVKTSVSLRQQLNVNIEYLEKRLNECIVTNVWERRLEEVNDKVKELSENILEDDYSKSINEKCIEHDKILDENDVLLQDFTTLGKLSKSISFLQCYYLENLIGTINEKLNDNLSILFDEEMNVTLELIKQQKNKNIKAGLFLKILYKGNEYDSIKFLSGGEADRLSLALILAFNSLYLGRRRMLFLDESFASINSGIRERCVSLLKNCGGLILVVCHEEVEGYYDSVYSI